MPGIYPLNLDSLVFDDAIVRRLGLAVAALWPMLPSTCQELLVLQVGQIRDRENTIVEAEGLEAFLTKFQETLARD